MDKIIRHSVNKPPRRQPHIDMPIEKIVAMVNALANPGGPLIDWFASDPAARAAAHFKDGEYQHAKSNLAVVHGGTITGQTVSALKVVAYDGNEGGVLAEGTASHVQVGGAVINLSGSGKGIGGPATGAAVRDHGELELRNVVIDTYGASRFCTVAEKHSTLRVYDSILIAHGVPYGEGITSPQGLMATPPPALEIAGNSRTHCTMSNSRSYFYNSKIISDGWAALSTEAAEGYVCLEANDCEVIVTRQGYGAYADPDCHDSFNRCRFDIDGMAAIIAGEAEMTFTDCQATCASYFCLTHNVNGQPEEVGTLRVIGGTAESQKEFVLVKSQNTQIEFDHAQLRAANGVLVRTIRNDDPCATQPDAAPFGVNVLFRAMNVRGDLVHEDTARDLWISLRSTTLEGAIQNGHLDLDEDSRWIATRDSRVVLTTDIMLAQIDARPGVTITAIGASPCSIGLPGGGRLIVQLYESSNKGG